MRATCKNHPHVRLKVSHGFMSSEFGPNVMSGKRDLHLGPAVTFCGVALAVAKPDTLRGGWTDLEFSPDQPCENCHYSDIVILRD